MAPSFDADVSVSTLIAANKKGAPIAEGSEAFHRFFDECSVIHSEDSDRPRKRARRENNDHAATPASSASRIVIARLDVNFRPTRDAPLDQHSTLISEQDIQVGLIQIENLRDARLRLSLVGEPSFKKSLCLTLETANPASPHISDVLARVACLERRLRRRGKHGVCQSTCRLHCSQGPTGCTYTLECAINWIDGESAFGPAAVKKEDWEVLTSFYPEPLGQQRSWKPQEFYASVHSPPADAPVPEVVEQKVLETELYPFQKRAVAWMLERENPNSNDCSSYFSYSPVQDAEKKACFVSHLEGVLCSNSIFGAHKEPRGGILAEEMGLGKTCELIALMCLNKRKPPEMKLEDGPGADSGLITSKATLIVTPPTILQQWKDELVRHVPGLSVLHYKGMPSISTSKGDIGPTLEDFAQRDVVITTYAVLAKEVHFAVDPPSRSLRQRERKHTRPRSPLVQTHWWRVCLDEAQMVESGVSAAAQVASLLPREHAWAVSGTPLKKDVQDLFGLLIFLRYRPFCDSSIIWTRLTRQYGNVFKDIFGRIALRHTKDSIRHELRLPPQRRVVLTLPFTQIEEQNYNTLFETMCQECGCTPDGSPLIDNREPDSSSVLEAMRSWLLRLRQTCLHAQVGGRNRKALGRGQGPLRTVSEVLEVMIEQNETAIRTESRLAITTQLLRGHIIGNAKDDVHRAEKALEIYKEALRESEAIVSDCRADVARMGGIEEDVGSSSEDSDNDGTPEQVSRGRYRAALHSALQLQHACAFFVGTTFFQMKANTEITEPDSDRFRELEEQETSFYDVAKVIRKELLRENATKSERLMRTIEQRRDDSILNEPSRLGSMDTPGGVENVKLVYKARDLAKIFDAQAKLINVWKAKLTELLLKPLVDKDEEGVEMTGEEYEDSTKQQDTLYAYIDALRAIIADRSTCITGQSAPLIDHEMNVIARGAREGEGHAPELMLELLEQRNKLKQKPDELFSLRGLVHEARGIETALQWQEGNGRADAELHIVKAQVKQLQAISSEESKIFAHLERINDLFRSTMNQRLEFYRQLQHISDMVAPHKEDWDESLDKQALEAATRRQETQSRSLAALKTKNRFLLHLREESNSQETQRICVICQSSFEQGVLTVCGHQYCKECINAWYSSHRTCPVCKRRLTLADFHQVTYKPQELRAQQEMHSSEPSSPSTKSQTPQAQSIYSDIGSETLSQIKSIDLNGSFGTKIDTLSRHILWIREHDPGAKAIVFSQFREFLDVLGTAFGQFGIGYSRMGRSGAIDKFKHDASVECFLLDAKTDSSGLNLVNAQYVFLAEPLINTAIELQAIARVHRIGQQRPTTVYMYLIGDTVEEAIYEISVTRRLAHMQSNKREQRSKSATPALGEAAIDAANSLELQQAPISKLLVQGKGGGELVPNGDLWSCLFGRAGRIQSQQAVSEQLQAEVGRHLRAEAAEQRRDE